MRGVDCRLSTGVSMIWSTADCQGLVFEAEKAAICAETVVARPFAAPARWQHAVRDLQLEI